MIQTIHPSELAELCWELVKILILYTLKHDDLNHQHSCIFLIMKSMLTCITHEYQWLASSKSMLTWITNIVVFFYFEKYVDLYHPLVLQKYVDLNHQLYCVFLILKSMLTCITYRYFWIALSLSMLTWITDIIMFSSFWKVCWLVSPRGISELLYP